MNETPLRLLLLEDNPDDAELLRLALTGFAPRNSSVTCVERLADALARIRTDSFDAMLSDLGLPDSSGSATVQAIAEQAPDLPLVVLTGLEDEDIGRAAIQQGAQDYLVKGQSSGALMVRTLRYAIERKRLEAGLRAANEALARRVAERTADLEAANAALRAAEEQFRGLVEQSIAGTYIIQDGKFAYVNPRFAEIFGYGSADELIGRDALSLVAEKDRGSRGGELCAADRRRDAEHSYEFHRTAQGRLD